MNQAVHNKLVSFIWSIADDCLRDVYVRGKYRDVILPMVVLRRLDALLEPSKDQVMEEMKFQKVELGLSELDSDGLRRVTGYVFYNTSKWTLQRLFNTATNNKKILEQNFMDYLNGFSPNVLEIVEKFKLKSQISHMNNKDVLLDVVEKFISPNINLTHEEKEDPDGRKLPALTNLGMGYVFEELIRKFNEENNEEAGEHFTPREVIELMTRLVFEPIKDQLPPVITIYDPACGSGGMLTESQNFIKDEEGEIKATSDVYVYGKEINDETYAICKSDMIVKDNNPENIKVGSTLAADSFSEKKFDFMLSNPPYGKSWSSDLKHIKDGKTIIDPRFEVKLTDYWGNLETCDATPRSSDGQLLFLMEMVDKMKSTNQSSVGSRIASVHNGSSLFTGDAGGGESNIRRYIIENDLLEAIVQMPNNLFYNTGITTYIWLLSNNKADARKGKVQLIEGSLLFKKLRKNLGDKNCKFTPEHIHEIVQTYLESKEIEREINPETNEEEGIASKVFDNEDFGYYKVTIERPNRLMCQFSEERVESLRYDNYLEEPMKWAYTEFGDALYEDLKQFEKKILDWCEESEDIDLTKGQRNKLLKKSTWENQRKILLASELLMKEIGTEVHSNFNAFEETVNAVLKDHKVKLSASDKNKLFGAVTWYDESADKVIKRTKRWKPEKLEELCIHLGCTEEQLPDFGYYPTGKTNEFIEYDTATDLRDTENVPLKQSIHEYFIREVQPHVAEAWIDLDKTKIGYEISFNKYFYRHKPLRDLEEVAADILKLEEKSEGLIHEILSLA